MEKRLSELLEGKGDNYILPFFWQHGEPADMLEEGMEKIHASGIGAVCVESRPHPDFAGELWWRDMDVILKKAKELSMKVWILDDAHFPSGFCIGRAGEGSPYGKTYLTHYTVDAVGPLKGSAFMLSLQPGEVLIGAAAARRDRKDPAHISEILDITDRVQDGKIYFDVPEGFYSITVIKTTKKGMGRPGYINVLDQDAVRFFLESVYEPHYEHYGSDFGETIQGFFSDEPEIGNVCGQYVHDIFLGRKDMHLPWCPELERLLKEKWQSRFTEKLLLLWNRADEGTDEARYEFMDMVSMLYGKNFTGQIGDWCRRRGVEYIGHVIEDGGCHARLGLGAGHFFRALWGQDRSGIDVVLQQIRPDLDDTAFYRIGGEQFYYGEFFHYGLAKMGVSLGHLDPKKKGRTMCEIYGAYGWSEGLKLMKWLTDHMLVRGVNSFVPHAFTMKKFPDPDCPPHFYAGGNNPQYGYFRYLMEYMNRVSHLINGGRHIPWAAVYYTGEADWISWDNPYQPFETVGRWLAKSQIDYEVVPEDVLVDSQAVNGELRIGNELVRVLILPEMPYISSRMADFCEMAAKKGLKIIAVNRLPRVLGAPGRTLEGTGIWKVSGEELLDTLAESGLWEIQARNRSPYLRYYHYAQKEGEYFLFFNESSVSRVDTDLWMPYLKQKKLYCYNAFDNRMETADWNAGSRNLSLRLEPFEMKVVYAGDLEGYEAIRPVKPEEGKKMPVDGPWQVSRRRAGGEWGSYSRWSGLKDLSQADMEPDFSGLIRYQCEIQAENLPEGSRKVLDLGRVYETAEVRVNGSLAGVRIAPPYRLEVTGLLKTGVNQLEIIVANTLVHRLRDHLSMTMPMEPSGLLGPVMLQITEE